ncbi:hypothetical protein RchiOBHm_Chr1g0319031 [Rosa chinensis]|uniref:Uncharacterized protein n=1 Tax=Rosa chinensis TaxID=74649 RepID=A0A2P6S8C3_ROSCH|nr:hypothetical protein RchiOBHm_Chr1g0319031 [Rosa chinensis]
MARVRIVGVSFIFDFRILVIDWKGFKREHNSKRLCQMSKTI